MTECCSCETQRGEDSDLPRSPGATFDNENSGCLQRETQTSNVPAYVAGVRAQLLRAAQSALASHP